MRNFIIDIKIDLYWWWCEFVVAPIYHNYELTVEYIDTIPDVMFDLLRLVKNGK